MKYAAIGFRNSGRFLVINPCRDEREARKTAQWMKISNYLDAVACVEAFSDTGVRHAAERWASDRKRRLDKKRRRSASLPDDSLS